jgi:glutamyl-tRNA reductase
LRVSAGLDSLVLGEPQILGQTKAAYAEASSAGTLGRTLERAFQHAFTTAKQVRTETAIGANPVSVAFAAVTLAKQIFGDISTKTALLIGAGETIELTARHLREHGLRRMLIANRTPERAQTLAEALHADIIELGQMPEKLHLGDIVIASTASPLPLLGKGMVERALKQRKHRPMFMVDLAVPRDIEPEAGQLDDVYLYTVDDLREVIEENLRSRQQAAQQAEEIVELQVERFMEWMRGQDAVSTVRRFREHAEHQRDEVLRRALHRLAKGEPPQRVLEYLARALTNKLIHAPTCGIRKAAERGELELIEAAKALLDVDDEDHP